LKKKLFKLLKIFLVSLFAIGIFLITILYFSLHKKMPEGIEGKEADQFAIKIQKAVQHDKYLATDYIQWTFRNKNHYLWNKKTGYVEVKWDEYIFKLSLKTPHNSTVLSANNFSEEEEQKMIKKAFDNFNNDSFWVVAPHKLFDAGVTRKLVDLEDGTKGLLVTYASGGSTPGDSYLWEVDKNYLPTSYQMWVSIIPFGGIEASWEDWTTTESGVYLAKYHKTLGIGVPISNLRAWSE